MDKTVILLLPEKTDIEFEQVANAWLKRGGLVKRLGKYWIKDEELAKHPIAVYGNQPFCLVLTQLYNAALISVNDLLIAELDNVWTKRNIIITQIGQLEENIFPCFIKPVIPKMFEAKVFKKLADFENTNGGLSKTEDVFVTEIITIEAEARSYLMHGEVKDIALYEGMADLAIARTFLESFIRNTQTLLPVVVIDLAFSTAKGWLILEFNSCWGAGLNNCDAEKVIDCIISATVNTNSQ